MVPPWASMERFCLCCLCEQWLKIYCKDLNGTEMRPVDDLCLAVCSCWQMKKCDLYDISNQSRLKSIRSVCVLVTNIRVLVKLIMASVLICVSCNGSFPAWLPLIASEVIKRDCTCTWYHFTTSSHSSINQLYLFERDRASYWTSACRTVNMPDCSH